jgi:hypothetical protein
VSFSYGFPLVTVGLNNCDFLGTGARSGVRLIKVSSSDIDVTLSCIADWLAVIEESELVSSSWKDALLFDSPVELVGSYSYWR